MNGVAVARNQQAFRWGRRYATDPAAVLEASGHHQARTLVVLREHGGSGAPVALPGDLPPGVRRLVEVRVPELVADQGVGLARNYLEVVGAGRRT